jgi:ribose transport system ATP-binding protein
MGQVMAGLKKISKGKVLAFGEELKGIQHAGKLKIGYISKNRDTDTLILNESIQDNLTISAWNLLRKLKLLILPGDEKKFANEQIDLLKIKCSSRKQLVRELSGGNKQKVSFGKLIGNNSKILILDSPTRGVDVGVKTTMYQLIHDMKNQGFAILIISEELPELIGMSDRILIFKDGKIKKEFYRSDTLRDTDVIEYMI